MPYCFLKLTFQALCKIDHLPHFHGALWSSLLRFGYNYFLEKGESFNQAGVIVSPADSAVITYQRLDLIEVGVALPEKELERFQKVVEQLNYLPDSHGHFVPNKTIRLLHSHCRLSERPWPDFAPTPLAKHHLKASVQQLAIHLECQLVFHSPLRLTRPPHQKAQHRYCDEIFFRQHPQQCHHLLRQIFATQELETSTEDLEAMESEICHGLWLDVGYGGDRGKTLGGMVGILPLKGKLSPPLLEALIRSQWLGVGKNRAFGFGQFMIPQIQMVSPLIPLKKHTHLLKEAMQPEALSKCLQDFSNTLSDSGGPIQKAFRSTGFSELKKLTKTVLHGDYQLGMSLLEDRLLQQAVAQSLNKVLEQWLSKSSFAYRAGLNPEGAMQRYQKAQQLGYCYGIQIDLHTFFKSINRDRLQALCAGFFARDPVIDLVLQWLQKESKIQGLPQNSPLSPVLCHLFLDQMDRASAFCHLVLIRFDHEFMILCQSEEDRQFTITLIEKEFKALNVVPELTKVAHFQPDSTIDFWDVNSLKGRHWLNRLPQR